MIKQLKIWIKMAYTSVSFDVTASVLYFDTTNYNYQYLDIAIPANNVSGCATFVTESGLTYEAYIYNVDPYF
jgi:hypothetical protein